MKGKYSQTDIRKMLGTNTVQLEIDVRTLRYVGHIARMPEDRWEYKLLFGLVMKDESITHTKTKDIWWERLRKVLKEVMHLHPGRETWYEIAREKVDSRNKWEWKGVLYGGGKWKMDKIENTSGGSNSRIGNIAPSRWKGLCKKWRESRQDAEKVDTHEHREELWMLAAKGFRSALMAEMVWKGVKGPDARGTPLDGEPILLLKQIVLAGGVAKQGWVEGVDPDWKLALADECSQAWLHKEGAESEEDY